MSITIPIYNSGLNVNIRRNIYNLIIETLKNYPCEELCANEIRILIRKKHKTGRLGLNHQRVSRLLVELESLKIVSGKKRLVKRQMNTAHVKYYTLN